MSDFKKNFKFICFLRVEAHTETVRIAIWLQVRARALIDLDNHRF